jgi:hypothetical protein
MNSKDTSSKKQGKSSVENNNISNKNVTHTDHRSKTKSNNVADGITDDYKYTPGADRPKSGTTENKRPSSGNIRGV